MTKQEYKVLTDKYTNEELAEAFVFPVKLTPKQKIEADVALMNILKKRRAAMSDEDKLKRQLVTITVSDGGLYK